MQSARTFADQSWSRTFKTSLTSCLLKSFDRDISVSCVRQCGECVLGSLTCQFFNHIDAIPRHSEILNVAQSADIDCYCALFVNELFKNPCIPDFQSIYRSIIKITLLINFIGKYQFVLSHFKRFNHIIDMDYGQKSKLRFIRVSKIKIRPVVARRISCGSLDVQPYYYRSDQIVGVHIYIFKCCIGSCSLNHLFNVKVAFWYTLCECKFQ
ncbi:Hypothetical_protein [Hexamita inflata]|uniref:Hypothetical_protein n=1 Tax=Hexamita inflata TaxID=28002 RepID=A0AA86QM55_9EUKA|nr:Hypothetical protein HINF_LOCUS46029 [Hexamita inflata]CAI9958386.1 Hypothetical protein HINF_LOCUS46031 [Hexamita inflata]CAI9958387.1 Hypothetical protein HINF_LOCUS46032 [Hexamita inflata]